MAKQSAGILVFRKHSGVVEVLLAHPGGPFWANKDSWSIPKGELDDGEDLQVAAEREFKEEVGFDRPAGKLIELGEAKQSGKTNYIWAVEGDPDLKQFKSNMFKMEWPPKSGTEQEYPEVDRIKWFDLATAQIKVYKYQVVYFDRLAEAIGTTIETKAVPEQQTLL